MVTKGKSAICPTREENYPQWYQEVVKEAELAEVSSVRGCMVIKPWGYGIWERIQSEFDKRFKATGHENAYFPLFIPLSFLEKEAEHVEGFAKECAVVTHHRLKEKDGKLVPDGELEEPLVVRPTSETIIGDSFSRWVQSYRDLPLLINQWANIVRWEMRTRLFLRTTEFLWQEGHTAHATEKEAMEETMAILDLYSEVAENVLALPVIKGEKTEGERFPGAVRTFCIEAMMQDRKALQAGTSHYLGQNFAKASDIKFLNRKGELEYAYTTSWGVSTRLIGALIMVHGDDDGMRVPPRVSAKHCVILPVIPSDDDRGQVLEYADKIKAELEGKSFHGAPIVVQVDKRDIRGGVKNWQWVKRGIPLRIEVGPKDIDKEQVVLYRRDRSPRDKAFISKSELVASIGDTLNSVQQNYFQEAKSLLENNIVCDLKSYDELKQLFTPKNPESPEIHGAFVKAKWCGDRESEKLLADLKLSIRCMPLEQSGDSGKCILTGKEATTDVIIAKAY